MTTERTLEKIEGTVAAQTVLKGTGSEHHGLVITTRDGEQLRLQRVGGNPFSDPVTESLAGQSVALEGFRVGNVFRFTRICEADEAPADEPGSRKKRK
jgi:hypothetical protein